jgi:hypothetical protein
MLSRLKTSVWWEVVIGAGIGIGCFVFMLANTGCASTQGASYTPNQIACQHVAKGKQHAPDAEACSKAVMRSYVRAVGAPKTMCWVQARAIDCVPRYAVDMWQVRAVIRDNGKAWHIDGIMYPKTGGWKKAPLSGTIT